ncbi:MAG: hypothetical protein JNJ45_04275 [Chthonomonas sp.]|nr:hypothetical protein [Chthonomonas sp.]
MIVGLVIGGYLLAAGGFYAFMNLSAQPEPEYEALFSTGPVQFRVVDGGLGSEQGDAEIKRAA